MIGRSARWLIDDFAGELNALRAERGFTWEELSRRAGVSRTYLRSLAGGRDGHGLPSEDVVAKVAVALDVDADHFRITRARAVLSSRKAIDVVYAKLTAAAK